MIKCTFEDGGEASLRHVTVNAVIIKDKKVLLGKRGTYNDGKTLLEAGKYALLGGFFSRDESLEEAVKREVFEESGWTISNLRLLRVNDDPNRPKEDRQNVDIIFVADANSQDGKSDEEVTELKWFDLDDLPNESDVAFDHYDSLVIYIRSVAGEMSLPVVGPFKKGSQ